jgi:3'-phosphoadenosine 5'-phosphosulfate sulfotransferase (PAPS reductase)/FAD synthetase
MRQIKEELEEIAGRKKCVFLFTGNKESTLLMSFLNDMKIDAVFIDTNCQFDEINEYARSFGSALEIVKSENVSVSSADDFQKCCYQHKVIPLKKILEAKKADCLIVPFRDEEIGNGVENSYLQDIDNIKIIRPLSDMSEAEVWTMIREKKLSYSDIYNKGYMIVDCNCCTTRHGRKMHRNPAETDKFDRETEEKLKALGYM